MATKKRLSESRKAVAQRERTARKKAAGLFKLQLDVPASRVDAIRSMVRAMVEGSNLPTPADIEELAQKLAIAQAQLDEAQRKAAANVAALARQLKAEHAAALASLTDELGSEIDEKNEEISRLQAHAKSIEDQLNYAREASKQANSELSRIEGKVFWLPWSITAIAVLAAAAMYFLRVSVG
jgi:chromosome segregation ATPase